MKKTKTFVTLALVSLLAASGLQASQEKKQQRLKVMHTYAGALHMVQDGFLYNNKTKILNGAKTLHDTAREVLGHDMQSHLPKNQEYTYKFAKKITERVLVHADGITDATKRANPLEAMDEFNYVIKQCTSCHLRVRSW
ncbi:MAG TPA: hypothetical protein ENK90_01725 [Epsilonproteobacteria bacterium]|nr:hypothetical protein [Campylobacterota bacterium]